jgi:hypothetical protein
MNVEKRICDDDGKESNKVCAEKTEDGDDDEVEEDNSILEDELQMV